MVYWINWESKKFKSGGNAAVGKYFDTPVKAANHLVSTNVSIYPKDTVFHIKKWKI